MPGNIRSGRRPDPTKPTAPKAEGEPIRPDDLGEHGAWLWDSVVPWIHKRAGGGAVDTVALRMMCDDYEFYQRTLRVAKRNEVGHLVTDIRMALVNYQTAYDRWASRFGLTPADRIRLLTGAADSEENPLAKFGVVG